MADDNSYAEAGGIMALSSVPDDVLDVLVIDDSEDIRDLVSMWLRLEGYSVDTAVNGLEALDRLRKSVPRVIVCDVMMPVMDGWTFLERKSSDSRLAGVPVIMASAAMEFVEGAGYQERITKPFEMSQLVLLIEKVSKTPL